jgi:hypothetical protein
MTTPDPSRSDPGRSDPGRSDPALSAPAVPDPALRGKVAVVTGAARGIGAALALALARRGVRVALVGLEPDALAAAGAVHALVWGPRVGR